MTLRRRLHFGLWILALMPTFAAAPELATAQVAAAPAPNTLLSEGKLHVRVSTEPDAGTQIVLGQQTRLFVEILTDTWFSHAPRYPELKLPGAITLLPEQMGTNFTELIDGVTYAGQRRSYVIFPQRTGQLQIPPLEIRLGVSQEGQDGTPFVATTRAIDLRVIARVGAEDRDELLTTTRLVVSDTWDRSLDDLEAGDAITRTVRLQGDQTLGMLLPEITFEVPTGIAVYSDQPRIADRVNRGQYRGERTQTVTYVLQRSGSFELPAIELSWWDPRLGQLNSETLAGQTLEVSGSGVGVLPESGASAFGSRVLRFAAQFAAWLNRNWIALMCAAVGLVALFRVSRVALPRLRAVVSSAREHYRNSEGQAYRALKQSLASGDESEIVRNYWLWRDRLLSTHPATSERLWSQFANTSARCPQWRAFEASRYGSASSQKNRVDHNALRRELQNLRTEFRAKTRSTSRQGVAAPGDTRPLNPPNRPQM